MDIKCVVCGEPWDSYGITHGDMLQWEVKLFHAGAGCPCCEGVSNGYEPTTLSDVENGDADPMLRIMARDAHEQGTAPKWTRPEDPKHWECDGCGVQVRTDLDDGSLVYRCPWGTTSRDNEYEFERHGTPEEKPAHTFEGGFAVCEFCLASCEKCSAPLSHRIERDVYDDGYVWTVGNDHEHAFCSDCHSEAEYEEACRVWADCYDARERLEYMREHWSEFEHCHAKYYPKDAWRNLLDCVRGRVFYGYASELVCR